jgi:hypothetical protein
MTRVCRLLLGCGVLLAAVGCSSERTSSPTPVSTLPTPVATPVPLYFADFESGLPPEFGGGGTVEGTQGYATVSTFKARFLCNDEGSPQTPTQLTL